jgi:hypothetical protein
MGKYFAARVGDHHRRPIMMPAEVFDSGEEPHHFLLGYTMSALPRRTGSFQCFNLGAKRAKYKPRKGYKRRDLV